MRKRLVAAIIITAIGLIALTSCSDDPAIGFWVVNQVTAGEVVMTGEDATSIGLNAVGTVKLQKSGNCEVTLLGEESTGTWKKSDDGTITINYGEDLVLTGSMDNDGVMTLTDPQGAEYELTK